MVMTALKRGAHPNKKPKIEHPGYRLLTRQMRDRLIKFMDAVWEKVRKAEHVDCKIVFNPNDPEMPAFFSKLGKHHNHVLHCRVHLADVRRARGSERQPPEGR